MDHAAPTPPRPRRVSDTTRSTFPLHPRRVHQELPALPGSAAVRWRGRQPLVSLTGDIDLAMARRLEAVGLLLRSWRSLVLVDAAAVTFLDAAGLRAVLSLAGGDACHEATVVLQQSSVAVVRLLEIAVAAGAGVRLDPSAALSGLHPEVPEQGWALTGLPGW